MFTRLTYLYRDAANYKVFGDVMLVGPLFEEQWRQLTSMCDGDRLFVAEQVGLPDLLACMQARAGGSSVDDHGWHELVGATAVPAMSDERVCWGTTEQLMARFRQVTCWTVQDPTSTW